jgi:hypothetical protein
MRRLSRELISALRLSFEAWPDLAARLAVCGISSPMGFEEGSPKKAVGLASNRVTLVSVFHGSQIRLRQSDYELRMLNGFGH